MHFRPHLRLSRNRLLWGAVASLAFVLLEFTMTVADGLDPGIFWHHACNCPIDPSDTRILLSMATDFLFLGILFGFVVGAGNTTRPPAVQFLLTRPQSRLQLLLVPFLIGGVAIALLPGLSWLALIGWLYMVHAPALGHLVAVLEVLPNASRLGPHPTFQALAAATHMGRFYAAGVAVGLCTYVVLSSGRWLQHSRFTSLKIIGALSSTSGFLLMFALRFAWVRTFLFLPPSHTALTYLPTETAIVLHFAFAAAWFYGTLRVIRDLDF